MLLKWYIHAICCALFHLRDFIHPLKIRTPKFSCEKHIFIVEMKRNCVRFYSLSSGRGDDDDEGGSGNYFFMQNGLSSASKAILLHASSLSFTTYKYRLYRIHRKWINLSNNISIDGVYKINPPEEYTNCTTNDITSSILYINHLMMYIARTETHAIVHIALTEVDSKIASC